MFYRNFINKKNNQLFLFRAIFYIVSSEVFVRVVAFTIILKRFFNSHGGSFAMVEQKHVENSMRQCAEWSETSGNGA